MVNLEPEEIALVKKCLLEWAFNQYQKDCSIMPSSTVSYLNAKRNDYIDKIISKLENKNVFNL